MRNKNSEKTNFIKHFTTYVSKCQYKNIDNKEQTFSKENIDRIKRVPSEDKQLELIRELLSKSTSKNITLETKEEQEKYLDGIVLAIGELHKQIRKSIQYNDLDGLNIEKLLNFDIDEMSRFISTIVKSKEAFQAYPMERSEQINNYKRILEQFDAVISITRPLQEKRVLEYLDKENEYLEEVYYAEKEIRLQEVLPQAYTQIQNKGYEAVRYYIAEERYGEKFLSIYFRGQKGREAYLKVEFEQKNWRKEHWADEADQLFTKVSVEYNSDEKLPEMLIEELSKNDNALYAFEVMEDEKLMKLHSKDMGQIKETRYKTYLQERDENESIIPKSAKEMREKSKRTDLGYSQSGTHANDMDSFESYAKILREDYVETPEIFKKYFKHIEDTKKIKNKTSINKIGS